MRAPPDRDHPHETVDDDARRERKRRRRNERGAHTLRARPSLARDHGERVLHASLPSIPPAPSNGGDTQDDQDSSTKANSTNDAQGEDAVGKHDSGEPQEGPRPTNAHASSRTKPASAAPRQNETDTQGKADRPIGSSFRSGWSRRNHRHTPEQTRYLEGRFAANPLPDAKEKEEIAKEVGTDKRTVTIWYQNKRARMRRASLSSPVEGSKSRSDDGGSSPIAPKTACARCGACAKREGKKEDVPPTETPSSEVANPDA